MGLAIIVGACFAYRMGLFAILEWLDLGGGLRRTDLLCRTDYLPEMAGGILVGYWEPKSFTRAFRRRDKSP